MNLKALAAGVLTLSLSNSAAFAAASPIANHLTLMPIVCGGEQLQFSPKITIEDGFSRVVKGVYQGGLSEEVDDEFIGFRLDSQNIKTFSFNLAQTGSPEVFLVEAYRLNFQNFLERDEDGLTITPLNNGTSRYSYDVRNSDIPVSGKVTSVYVLCDNTDGGWTITASSFLGNGQTITGIPQLGEDCTTQR